MVIPQHPLVHNVQKIGIDSVGQATIMHRRLIITHLSQWGRFLMRITGTFNSMRLSYFLIDLSTRPTIFEFVDTCERVSRAFRGRIDPSFVQHPSRCRVHGRFINLAAEPIRRAYPRASSAPFLAIDVRQQVLLTADRGIVTV